MIVPGVMLLAVNSTHHYDHRTYFCLHSTVKRTRFCRRSSCLCGRVRLFRLEPVLMTNCAGLMLLRHRLGSICIWNPWPGPLDICNVLADSTNAYKLSALQWIAELRDSWRFVRKPYSEMFSGASLLNLFGEQHRVPRMESSADYGASRTAEMANQLVCGNSVPTYQFSCLALGCDLGLYKTLTDYGPITAG